MCTPDTVSRITALSYVVI